MRSRASCCGAILSSFLLCFSETGRAETQGDLAPYAFGGPRAHHQGELGRQAEQLAELWGEQAKVDRLAPQFLERGDSLDVWMDPSLLDAGRKDCVTVAALSMPNLSFLLVFQDEKLDPNRRAWPIPSAAGVAEVTRCGARKPLLRALAAKMRSRRGVVEFLIARSEHPPQPASQILRGRRAGPTAPSPHVGNRPHLPPLKSRLAKRSMFHRRRGAVRVEQSASPSDERGQGTSVVHLDSGCHVLNILAEANPSSPPDVDARLFTLIRGNQMASDEEQSGQATLTHCVGRAERFRIDFTGAPPNSDVVLLHAEFELPPGIPAAWGPLSRANLARALFEAGLPPVTVPPSFATLGVRGTTTLHPNVEPDGCYSVVAAPIRGELRRISLGVQWGAEVRESQGMVDGEGTALSFCASGYDSVHLEVQALGESLAWIVGVWPMTTAPAPSQDPRHGTADGSLP